MVGASSAAQFLKTIGGMPSGPGGLYMCKFMRCVLTSLHVMSGRQNVVVRGGYDGMEDGACMVELSENIDAKRSAFSRGRWTVVLER